MAARVYLNNISTRLTAAVAPSDLTINVTAGTGVNFAAATGGDWITATLVKVSGYREIAWEIVKVTARSTDALTITRAQEGTSALSFAIGDVVDVRFTADLAAGVAAAAAVAAAVAIAGITIGTSNFTIAATRGSSAETVAIKTKAGADPSANDPVYVGFRNATLGTGDYSILTLTAALSLTIPSTALMGASNGVPFRLWLVIFNDAGTARLGLVNCFMTDGIFPLKDDLLASSTIMDTGSDSAGVIYTGTAVTSKAMRVLGYLDYTLAAAGTWGTAPSQIQIWGTGQKLPGDTVQVRYNQTGAVANHATAIPWDDTIPQITEGDEYMTQAIVPTALANRLRIQHLGNYAITGTVQHSVALFQDATANALAAMSTFYSATDQGYQAVLEHEMRAATVSSTTFRIRAGGSIANTTTFNGSNTGRKFGGVGASFLRVTEILG